MLAKLIHGDITLHSEVYKETRMAALKKLFKIKSDLKKHKSTIIKEELALIKQINNITQKTLESLNSQNKKLNEYILKVLDLKEIDNSKESTFIESLLKVSPKDLSKIKSIQSPDLHINQIKSECIQNLFNLDELSEENILIDMNCKNSPYSLRFFLLTHSSLCTFNVETKRIDMVKIPYETSFKDHGASCLLPDGTLFYYNINSAMIIDSEGSIKRLPDSNRTTWGACSVYYDGDIYIFGGSCNISAKFNIAKNRWFSNAKLPINIGGNCSGFMFKHYILIGSMKTSRIFYYDTLIDCYNEIAFLNIASWAPKIFFVVIDKLYFADISNNQYQITENFVIWDKKKDLTLWLCNPEPVISTPIIYNRKYYYANLRSLFTFDLIKKKIEEIMTLPRK